MADEKEGLHDKRFNQALQSDVPRIYFNGFVSGFSAGDIICVLERNSQPVGIVNMSYTVAKTLSASLATLVGLLEEASKQPIMTTHEVGKFLSETQESSKEKPKHARARPKQARARKKKND